MGFCTPLRFATAMGIACSRGLPRHTKGPCGLKFPDHHPASHHFLNSPTEVPPAGRPAAWCKQGTVIHHIAWKQLRTAAYAITRASPPQPLAHHAAPSIINALHFKVAKDIDALQLGANQLVFLSFLRPAAPQQILDVCKAAAAAAY